VIEIGNKANSTETLTSYRVAGFMMKNRDWSRVLIIKIMPASILTSEWTITIVFPLQTCMKQCSHRSFSIVTQQLRWLNERQSRCQVHSPACFWTEWHIDRWFCPEFQTWFSLSGMIPGVAMISDIVKKVKISWATSIFEIECHSSFQERPTEWSRTPDMINHGISWTSCCTD
jgi:hypothetical protein